MQSQLKELKDEASGGRQIAEDALARLQQFADEREARETEIYYKVTEPPGNIWIKGSIFSL